MSAVLANPPSAPIQESPGLWTLAWRRLRHTSHRAEHVAEMLATSAVIPFLSVYWRLRGALRWRVLFL